MISSEYAVEKHIKNTSAHAIIKPDFSRSQLFYDNLIGLLSSKHINYVIDESESALLTGQNWAHEVLMPHAKPLAVTFSGPTRISGYFHLGDLALNSTSFDVSVDSTKLQLFNLEHDVVLRDGLLKSANKAGLEILEELNLKLGKNYRTVGEGAYLDIICPTKEKAVELQDAFLKSGILVGHYANRVLIRASLTIGSRHVAIISRFVENLKL